MCKDQFIYQKRVVFTSYINLQAFVVSIVVASLLMKRRFLFCVAALHEIHRITHPQNARECAHGGPPKLVSPIAQ